MAETSQEDVRDNGIIPVVIPETPEDKLEDPNYEPGFSEFARRLSL